MTETYPHAGWTVEDDYTIGDYSAILYRRRGFILIIIVASVISTLAISENIEPRYEARAVFYVPEDVTVPSSVAGQERTRARTPSGNRNAARAHIGILKGDDTRKAISKRFPSKSVDALRRDVDFGATREALVLVYARDKDPKLAADIANAYVEYFNAFARATVENDLALTVERIDEQIRDIDVDLAVAIQAKEQFDESHGISSLVTALQELERSRIDLRESLQSAMAQERSAREELNAAAEQLGRESEIYRNGKAILDDTLVAYLQKALAEIALDIAEKGTALSLDHPEVLGLQEKFKVARQNLTDALDRIASSPVKGANTLYEELRGKKTILWVQTQGDAERILALRDAIAEVDAHIAQLPAMFAESQKLDDAIRERRDLKLALQDARNNRQVGALDIMQTAIVVETAAPPVRPIFPILWLNILVSVGGGLVAGIVGAIMLEHVEATRRRKRLHALAVEAWALEAIQEQSSP